MFDGEQTTGDLAAPRSGPAATLRWADAVLHQAPRQTRAPHGAERGGRGDGAGAAGSATALQPAQRAAPSDPERQLWCAVIIHTLYEASGRVAYAERGEHDEVRAAAIAWFEDAGEDFQAVCDLAGFLPAAIRENALRVIRGRRLPRIRISKAG